MKTKEELNALKEEVETVSRKLAELSEEELTQVIGGMYTTPPNRGKCPLCGGKLAQGAPIRLKRYPYPVTTYTCMDCDYTWLDHL